MNQKEENLAVAITFNQLTRSWSRSIGGGVAKNLDSLCGGKILVNNLLKAIDENNHSKHSHGRKSRVIY
jgi:hypothetical protein